MGSMFLEPEAVLHEVDRVAHFSSTTFLNADAELFEQSVENICLVHIMGWSLMYTGESIRLHTV